MPILSRFILHTSQQREFVNSIAATCGTSLRFHHLPASIDCNENFEHVYFRKFGRPPLRSRSLRAVCMTAMNNAAALLRQQLHAADEAATRGDVVGALQAWMALVPQLQQHGLIAEADAANVSVLRYLNIIEQARLDGNMLFKAKKWSEARAAYTRAIDLLPTDPALLTNRSAAAYRAGDLRASLADANSSVSLNPSWVKGHFRRGQALSALGVHEEAARAHEEAARLGAGTDASKELAAAAMEARAKAAAAVKQGPKEKATPQQLLDRAAAERELGLITSHATATGDDPSSLVSEIEQLARDDVEFVNILCSSMLPSTRRQKPGFDDWPTQRKRSVLDEWRRMWSGQLRDLARQSGALASPSAELQQRWAPLAAPDRPPARSAVSELLDLTIPPASSASAWESPFADMQARATARRSTTDPIALERQRRVQRERHDTFRSTPQHAFVQNARGPVYELYTEEMIAALASYLGQCVARCRQQRSKRYSPARPRSDDELTILEVGAADGRLSQYLRGRMPPGVRVVATDVQPRPNASGAWLSIEALEVAEALAAHRPTIVLACWMPAGRDWTAQFRSCGSVLEYLLIGPADGIISGHEWLTWGAAGAGEPGEPAPFAAEGWGRHMVAEVSRWQLCRTDLEELASSSVTGGALSLASEPEAGAEGAGAPFGEQKAGDFASASWVSASCTTSFRRGHSVGGTFACDASPLGSRATKM